MVVSTPLRFLTTAVICCIGTTALAAEEPNVPLAIRLVHGIPTVTIMAMMPSKKDMLPHFGKEYTLQLRRIDASSEVALVLGGESADIGFSATGAIINTNTKLNADLRIVGDVAQNGVQGQNAIWYSVRADDPIKAIRDLRGKTIATSGFGSWADLSMQVGMRKERFDPNKDARMVQLPFPAMEANLRERKVDLITLVPPFYQIANQKGGMRVLFTAADAQGTVQGLSLIARQSFLDKNPRRVQAFFDDYYRFIKYALDPKNRDEMSEIGAKLQNVPAAGIRGWWNTKEDFYRDPEGLPNVDAIKREMAVLKEYGIIQTTVDIDKWVNLSFMRNAARTFKR